MKIHTAFRHAALAIVCSSAFAAASLAVAAPGGRANEMTWTDLRQLNKPHVAAYRGLWAEKISISSKQWASSGDKSPLPAFTLSATFAAASPPVHVSIFSTMYDCVMPGNGAGVDMFARCTMKIVTGSDNRRRIKEVADVCQLWVDPVTSEADGPLQSKNHTSVELDANRVLHLRVTQYGKPVPACSLDVAVD